MCAQCLQTRYDIGEGIAKQVQQNTCRGCGRYERRDGSFAPVEPESAELMALLLKKPRGLASVRLVDASFVWTEPHSRRLKIKACVQKEVVSGAVMQQSFVIEYVLSNKQCGRCPLTRARAEPQPQPQLEPQPQLQPQCRGLEGKMRGRRAEQPKHVDHADALSNKQCGRMGQSAPLGVPCPPPGQSAPPWQRPPWQRPPSAGTQLRS